MIDTLGEYEQIHAIRVNTIPRPALYLLLCPPAFPIVPPLPRGSLEDLFSALRFAGIGGWQIV
jgi:hypothetical protein